MSNHYHLLRVTLRVTPLGRIELPADSVGFAILVTEVNRPCARAPQLGHMQIALSQIDPSCRSRSSGAGKSKLVPQYQPLALSGSNLLGDAIDLRLRGAKL